MTTTKYHLSTHFTLSEGNYYAITEANDYSVDDENIVWRRDIKEADDVDIGEYAYPADVRAKYEELSKTPEFDPNWTVEKFMDGIIGSSANMVELMDDEQSWDQPCLYGNRCGSHAVYCHNDGWLYSPRKCRRSWYYGDEALDSKCPGYFPNPTYTPVSDNSRP